MSEIEKLYKNAEVEKDLYCCDDTCGEPTKSCKDCSNYREIYPPFTAEKQIELIKWLAIKDCIVRVTYKREFLWCSQLELQSGFCYEKFEESLANLINTIWQDLTEEEKQQVKGILE